MRDTVKRVVLGLFGRPVRCELCGRPLFRAMPFVRRGKVKLSGAEHALVRVEFDSMNRLVFRHVQADRCPAQRPPYPV